MAQGHGASSRTAPWGSSRDRVFPSWCHGSLCTVAHIHATPLSQQTSWLSHSTCPWHCLGSYRVQFIPGREMLSLPFTACPKVVPWFINPWRLRHSAHGAAFAQGPLAGTEQCCHSNNIPIWALIDFIDPQPALCYAESQSPAQPCHQQLPPLSALPQQTPRAKLYQTPSCQTGDNILEQHLSVPSSTLWGVFWAAHPSPAASSLENGLVPIQVVIKKIEAKVHEQVKVCDMLLHQLNQWSQARDKRQRHLQELQDAETDPTWQEPQLQVPRSPSWCANTHGGL